MSEDKPVPPPEPAPPQQDAPSKTQFAQGRDPVQIPPKPYAGPARKPSQFDDSLDFGDTPAPPSARPGPAEPTPTLMDGCLKALGILIIGAFVLGGLVFATCFLAMSR